VLDSDGGSISDNALEQIKTLRDGLTEGAATLTTTRPSSSVIVPRQLKHFAFAPVVTISNDAQRPVTMPN
jgi:[protein-PII] uridylyltransferase